MSKQKTESSGRIAVIGEREIVIGYRLLGMDDTFIVSKDDANKTLQELFSSGKFGLIIVSEFVRNLLPNIFKTKIEASIEPLVLFMPSLQGNIQEESISVLAKRVLGINIQGS
jgi:V/A-type H+-transporting ATPase subunit F